MQNKHFFPLWESQRSGRGGGSSRLGQIPNFYRKFVSGASLSAPEESSISGFIGFICLNFVDLRAFLGVKFSLRDFLQYQENPRTGPELKERNFHLMLSGPTAAELHCIKSF